MQINGSTQVVFPDGSTQQNISLTATGNTGTVSYAVSAIPSQVVSIRKTAGSAPLAVGAQLTAEEAASLIATRTGSSGGLGPAITLSAVVGVKTRAFQTGSAAPAFTTGDATSVTAVKDGNFFLPDFAGVGNTTVTIDILLDIGSAITLAQITNLLMSLNYTGQTTDQWTGVTVNAIASADGTAISVLNPLSITANSGEPNTQKYISGAVTGASPGRWIGIRLSTVTRVYPAVFRGFASVQGSAGSASFTPLPTPVTFSVHGTDAGSGGGGLGPAIDSSTVVGVETRFYQSGTSAPAFTVGDATAVTAVHDSNYFIPNYPGSGTGTVTIDFLFDLGSAITLGKIDSLLLSLNYSGQSTDQWTGVTANAIASTDGTTVTVLNVLTLTANSGEPNTQRYLAGDVTGAPAARWVGVRLTNAPRAYPCIFRGFSVRASTGAGGGSGGSADFTVAIGDTSTNFGGTPTPTPTPSGNTVIYGDPGTRFPLGIYLRSPASSYNLVIPAGLSLVVQSATQGTAAVASAYTTNNATGPFAPSQTGSGVSSLALQISGTGKSFDGTFLNLAQGSYIYTAALGIGLATTPDQATTQVPQGITLNFVGVIPADTKNIISVYSYGEGGIVVFGNWQTTNIIARIERNGTSIDYQSISGLSNTAQEDVSVRYVDNPSGQGGTLTFLRNGVAFGPSQTTTIKPRISSNSALECNALTGNTAGGTAIKVKRLNISLDLPTANYVYTAVSSGSVTPTQLQNLFVDALAVSVTQASKTITYQPTGGNVQSLDVVIGPLVVAAGSAYRAVLENWSSGVAVDNSSVLVMTRLARQNCRFEDAALYDSQPAWIECLPQGPVPIINGIAYYCEAIRIGSYAQFQFGYDWNTNVMPANPFGDPHGLDSYMVPHKWRIEDSSGTLISRIARPDGGPLNGTDIPRIFNGSYDGRGVAITNATNKWYPSGTVRAGIIWRSAAPTAYAQTVISAQLPRYDVTVPYAMHTSYSTNGFDFRLYLGGAGGDGQSNGFGNTRVMPYDPTNYANLVSQAGITQDPYKASLYSANSLAAVASTWLKYTPFNQCGRTPLVGPGGIRDERCAVPEPVAQYMFNTAAVRPHDGKPFSTIALDYLTSYVSEPFQCFEAGRCVPLYKGSHASRVTTLRNHYYGAGEASTPPERAYYIQSGRLSDINANASSSPYRAYVPQGGSAADKPYFGTNAIDASHAHQLPYWGSLLWQTPEFAFLGHKLWDQTRLYLNLIIAEPSAERWVDREGAWIFLHAVLAWKTGSVNSDRLYTRQEALNFVISDFESFSDMHLTATPGFNNPPTNIMTGGAIDGKKGSYAAAQYFGAASYIDTNGTIGQHDFFIGYWVVALGIAEKLGFNSALRSSSAKAGTVLDWLIAQHRKRVVGRINGAPKANLADNSYLFYLWPASVITAAGGAVSALPHTYQAVATQNGNAATWDVSTTGGTAVLRDGEGMDQLIASPSILKNQLGQTGTDLDTAIATVNNWRTQKKNEQLALGADAGSTWFKYLNAVHNPALS